MNIDHKIRLVTICDINGKMMYSDYREGVENLPEESKKSLKLAVDAWKIQLMQLVGVLILFSYCYYALYAAAKEG